MKKRRLMFFIGIEFGDEPDVEDEVSTSAVGYMIDADEAVGEGWSQDHGDPPDDKAHSRGALYPL